MCDYCLQINNLDTRLNRVDLHSCGIGVENFIAKMQIFMKNFFNSCIEFWKFRKKVHIFDKVNQSIYTRD